ncbi:hypothetical protein BOX15_Mlig031314g1 [Macrostomum lignano]|uniref:Uncharacterized protein n=1 Tax=Macrostomum lignano TaxID=282301 RepID=A0A267H739_9PLAT|nr:hypothetical protein BOX15_Mlig031314g1 [Macrostomum lignano]
MSDWATRKPGSAYGGTDRDQLHSSASLVARSGRSGGRRLLSARELLLIWRPPRAPTRRCPHLGSAPAPTTSRMMRLAMGLRLPFISDLFQLHYNFIL